MNLVQRGSLSGLVVAATLALPSSLTAQDGDAWRPFMGCWVSSGDEGGAQLCIEPGVAPASSVWTTRFPDGEEVSEIVVADGTFRPVEEGDCEGESAARFSADGRYVFLEGRFDCLATDTPPSSGMLALTDTDSWVDIRSIDVEGSPVAFVQRYTRTDDLDGSGSAMSRFAASQPPTIERVIEVSSEVSSAVAAAWLSEVGVDRPVAVDGLIALDEAGAPTEVIDMVVAVSNPGRFALAGPAGAGPSARGGGGELLGRRAGASARCGYWGNSGRNIRAYSGFYGRYSGCYLSYLRTRNSGFLYDYRYGGGLGYYGYDGSYYWSPTPYRLIPTGGAAPANSGGRAVRGRGYTAGRGSSGSRGGSGSSGSAAPPRSSGSSGSASSGGSGSSSRGSTRRAKPRGGGGGLF